MVVAGSKYPWWHLDRNLAWLLNGMYDWARQCSLSSGFLIELSVSSVPFSSVYNNFCIFFICFTTKSSIMIANHCFLSFGDEVFSGSDFSDINFLWYCWFSFPSYAQDLPLSIHPSSISQRNFVPFWYDYPRHMAYRFWVCGSVIQAEVNGVYLLGSNWRWLFLFLHLTHVFSGLV